MNRLRDLVPFTQTDLMVIQGIAEKATLTLREAGFAPVSCLVLAAMLVRSAALPGHLSDAGNQVRQLALELDKEIETWQRSRS